MDDMDIRAQLRSRVVKEVSASERRTAARLHAWLMAPAEDGGLGMTVERADKAVRYFRGEAGEKRE